jgi:C-7 ketoreductase
LVVGRSESTLAETVKDHDTVSAFAIDITDTAAPAAVIDTALRELGRIDVLVNNATVLTEPSAGYVNGALFAIDGALSVT